MAQIIKYQQGGSASNSLNKYGTLTIDNQTYQVDNDLINQLYAYEKTLDPRVGQQFGRIIDAVKNGENIKYDSTGAGNITGNINFDLTNNQRERTKQQRRKFGSILGSIWNGKEQTAREAISALKNFNYVAPGLKQTKYDWSKSLQAEYEKDSEGRYIINNGARTFINGANNIAILNRISKLEEIANYKDNDIFQGYGDLDKQAYINLYNHLGKDGVQGLYDRVKNGTWTNADADALDDIGIFLRESNDSSSRSGNEDLEDEATLKNRFANAGLNYDLSSPYITIDENGAIRTTDAFNQAFGTNNGIYNDWWQSYLSKTQQWSPDFSWLKGYTRIGNRLYKTSDLNNENSELYQFAHQDGGFYDLNRQNKFSEANKILEYLWGRPDESSTWDSTRFYNKWMSQQDPSTFRYRSLSGQYELPDGQQLIEYWTGNERDMFGRPTEYSYAVFDKDGNLIEDKVDISKYKFIDGKQLPFKPLERIVDQNSPYNGRYIRTFVDSNKNPIEDIALYINPEDESDIIYYAKDLSKRSGIDGQNIRIPKELATAINNNPEFWNKLLSDKTLQDRFYRSLQEGVSTAIGEGLRNINFVTSPSTLTITDLISLGFDQNTAQNLYNYLENNWGDRNGQSRGSRRDSRLVNPYVASNQPVESHQTGGKIGTTVDNVGKNSTKNVGKYRAVEQVAGAHDDWNLSTADKLELASLAGDIASLVASIPTGGNPIAGALGYGSSLTQFAADIKRDGFDLKDLGGLAVNLGLDTVTLLPGIGVGGKSAKLIKSIKKVAKPLKNALLAVGAVQGVQGVTNLVNGNGTINDWKNVLNGLQAVVGGHRVYKDIKATKYKGKAPKTEAKTKTQLRNEYIDQIVKEGNLGKYNGQTARWANDDGTVKDYNLAIKDLTESGHLKISKAQEAKWAAEAAGSSTKTGLKNLFSSSYIPFSPNYRFRMSNRQLPEDFNLEQLAGNTSKLRTIGRVATENPEIAVQLKNQGWRIPKTFNFSSNYGGNWFYRSPVFTKGFKKGGKIIKAYNGIVYPTFSIVLDEWLNPNSKNQITTTVNQNNTQNNTTSDIKNDRKVPKIDYDFTDEWNYNFADTLGNKTYVGTTGGPRIKKATPIINERLQDQIDTSLNTIKIKPLNSTSIKREEPQSYSGGISYNFSNKLNQDALLGLTDFLISSRGINRSADKMKEAIRKGMIGSQQQIPTEIYPTFTDNGLHRMYDQRLDNIRRYKTVTSNPGEALTERLTRDFMADQIAAERDTKFSQVIDNYRNQILGLKQQYADQRRQIADSNKNRWAQGEAQLAMTEANRIGQQTQNWKNLIYQQRQNYAKDLQEKQQAEATSKQLQAQDAFYKSLADKYQNSYNQLTPEQRKEYNDLEDYAYKTDLRGYSALWNQAYANIPIDKHNEGQSHSWTGRPFIPRYQSPYSYTPQTSPLTIQMRKKGGTIQRYRNVDEQHYLDQQKAINKAVDNLNNNIVKLFLKMMS